MKENRKLLQEVLEDIRHDMYRPGFCDRIAAGLDAEGMPVAWHNRFAGSSILARWLPPAASCSTPPKI